MDSDTFNSGFLCLIGSSACSVAGSVADFDLGSRART